MPTFEPLAFSDQDFDVLQAWLLLCDGGITDITELEGYLTALVVGPVTLKPSRWIPKIFGRTEMFRTQEEFAEFVRLVLGFHDDIASCFEDEPVRFQPTCYEARVEGKRVLIVEGWCQGFMKGLRLNAPAWRPLRRDHPDLLKPLQLLGTRAGQRTIAAGDAVALHGKWSRQVAPAVRAIHAYWLPQRQSEFVDLPPATLH
jgi:uncharacterized protein